jgi:hypothetical protein
VNKSNQTYEVTKYNNSEVSLKKESPFLIIKDPSTKENFLSKKVRDGDLLFKKGGDYECLRNSKVYLHMISQKVIKSHLDHSIYGTEYSFFKNRYLKNLFNDDEY